MSQFDTYFRDYAQPVLMDHLGASTDDPDEAVIYWPASSDRPSIGAAELAGLTLDELRAMPLGEGVALRAILGPIVLDEQHDEEGRKIRQKRTVTISVDPDSPDGGVAHPQANAVLTIGGVAWPVEAIENISGVFADLRCVRAGSSEVSRPKYRGRA